MTCQQVQVNLSLYLYGELEFAKEEELELHLPGCSLCQIALSREKAWHTSLNAERQDVPLDLLSKCRRDLRVVLQAADTQPLRGRTWLSRLLPVSRTRLRFKKWSFEAMHLSPVRWSPKLAFASLFVFLGFSLARWADRFPAFTSLQFGDSTQAGLAPAFSRVRAGSRGRPEPSSDCCRSNSAARDRR